MIDQIRYELETWAAIIGSLTVIVMCRKWVGGFFTKLWKSAKALLELGEMNAILRKQSESIQRIEVSIFNKGNGLERRIDLLGAISESDFESALAPKFICDNKGGNCRVNQAYRQLVEVWRDDDIHGTQWMSVLTGHLREAYIAEFIRCATSGEDFIADAHFHNPTSNMPRGCWKVNAPATRIGDGSAIYVGTFTVALDDCAEQIAATHGWRVQGSVIAPAVVGEP